MSEFEKDKTSPEVANTYWQDVENKVLDSKALSQEFADGEFDSFSVKKTRRSFLKIMGFSVSALPLTGCIKIPVRKALPYLNKQDNTTPGVANWYASTFKGQPVLLKTREGRPIKVEGNDLSVTSFGGTDAQAQASVISLYDSYRLHSAMVDGKNVEWADFDKALKADLANGNGEVVIVTPSISSPSERALLKEVTSKMGATHVPYDAVSFAGFAKANEVTHGVYTYSDYNFEAADVVVSFGSDFLGSHPSSVTSSKQYVARRDAKHARGMNRHIQVEEKMSLTGSNADYRFTRSVADQNEILLAVLAGLTGGSTKTSANNADIVKQVLVELNKNKGTSLVVAGSNDVNTQVIVNKINDVLGNYNKTVMVNTKSFEHLADDSQVMDLVKKMNAGSVKAVIFAGVNPAYDFFAADQFTAALKKVPTTVSTATSEDETSKLCKYVAPMNHVYESWSDAMVSATELSVVQPVIQPLYGTRMWTETLMSLAGISGTFHEFMQGVWAKDLFTKQSKQSNAKNFWNQTLHDGVVTLSGVSTAAATKSYDVAPYAKALKAMKAKDGLNIVTYVKYGMGNGDMANNPFLQEMPNPITKATWDNYAMVSPKYAKANSIKSGDVVELTNGSHTVKLPAIVQPGTAENTVAIAVGYGRKVGGKVAKNLGANAFPFNAFNGTFVTNTSFGSLKKTGTFRGLAQTQTHHSMEGRDIVRETTFAEYMKNPKAGNQVPKPATVHIYPEHKKDGHQWAMVANLSQCTGCSSCIVSCNTENNIPVVGRQEVANRREMHWLRIDRYYKGDDAQPEVMHMPMLCQHCDNAPCENVCPVMATVQSSDGLNQQVYNRCVGTRYCANNCPYKVRRFNWFNYDRGTETEKLALNPDIGIRTRGIMEKCSMCVQRIQEGKLTAKRERRELKDGDIKLACQQSCPGDGIIFGDMNDPESKVAKFLKDERNYTVLEELNIQPRVSYLTKIRNK